MLDNVEGIDITKGIKDHPELVCVAIVINGVVIVLEDTTPEERTEA